MADEKVCARCRQVKPLTDFVRRKTGSRDGYTSRCKSCHTTYCQAWNAANPRGKSPLAHERRRYAVQKGDAKRRRIPFLLTFPEWLKVWTDSGHLHESGSFAGQYCMARRGDQGAYEVGNVRICTVEENHGEMRHGDAARAKISANNRVRWL